MMPERLLRLARLSPERWSTREVEQQLVPTRDSDRLVQLGIKSLSGALPQAPARGGVGCQLEDGLG